jgi:hypothetical protein
MTTYTGGCHCKKVRFEVDLEQLTAATACNCSMCSKRGWLLTFVPPAQFRLLSGEADLTEYRFNKKVISHLFCSTCGTASFGRGTGPDGTEMIAVNVRCLDDVDTDQLTIEKFDGKSI